MSSLPSRGYRNIIDSFKTKRLSEKEILQRLSDLSLLIDFSAGLNLQVELQDIANALLLTLMGYTHSRRAAFFVCRDGKMELLESKGHRPLPTLRKWEIDNLPPVEDYYRCDELKSGAFRQACSSMDLQMLFPLLKDGKVVALAGIGGKTGSETYTEDEVQMGISLTQMTVDSLENAQARQSLHSLNRKLNLKVYQLNTLFELSKDFHSVWDTESIFRILGTSLIGQLLISRCAVLTRTNRDLELKFLRGWRLDSETEETLRRFPLEKIFQVRGNPILCSELSPEWRDFCLSHKIHLAFPMEFNDNLKGLILLGEKRTRKPFVAEDYDLIATLANLALAAEENARMQQEMLQKQRMEKELAIARQIQMSLLPQELPRLRGWEISSVFEPCYTVGGDYFDFFPVAEDEFAIAIGDVSGKGTPAALLMASLQASLRTLRSVGMSDPESIIRNMNHLLCESQSQSNKYVTFFFAVLDYNSGRLTYINAGHCYPLVLKKNGVVDRLETGGTVLGFFRDATYQTAEYQVNSGDVLLLYTDGVSELTGTDEEEFGVQRIVQTIQTHQQEPVSQIQAALLRALTEHRGDSSTSDDITFIILKRD